MKIISGFFSVLLIFICASSLSAAEMAVADDAYHILTMKTAFKSADGEWKGKARVENERLIVENLRCAGSVEYSIDTDLSARGDDSLAITAQIGAKNTAAALHVRLTDQDNRACTWYFALPKTTEQTVLITARDGASLSLPNKPDLRDFGVNDLRRINKIEILGNHDEYGILDIQVMKLLTVKPDAAVLAARELLAKKLKTDQGNAKNRNDLAKRFVAAFPEITVATPAAVKGKEVVRAYHVGNSLTFKALSYQYKTWSLLAYEERVIALMNARGIKYVPGWHISWGASLPSIWSHKFEPAVANAGAAGIALKDYTWDILTLQLWGADAAGDVAAARNFIDMGIAKNPDLKVYLVETWVQKEDTLTPDFPTQWNRPWKDDQKYGIPPIHCKAYASLVFRRLQQKTADLRHPVRLIPIGTVMYELDKRMRAGEVPGYKRVEELYNDKVHLTENGNYVALETFYTVMFNKNPKGLPRTDMFPTVTDEFAAVVQDTIWKVVTTIPETGVADDVKKDK